MLLKQNKTWCASFARNKPHDFEVLTLFRQTAALKCCYKLLSECVVFGFVQGDSTVVGTSKLRDLYERFEEELGRRQARAKEARPQWEPPKTKLDEDPGKVEYYWSTSIQILAYACNWKM